MPQLGRWRHDGAAILPAICLLVCILVSGVHAASVPEKSEVERLDWVRVASGSCCLLGGGRGGGEVDVIARPPGAGPYSIWFRANEQDDQLFHGLSRTFFGEYRSSQLLKDIMGRKPKALAKLRNFDRDISASGRTGCIVSGGGFVVGLAIASAGLWFHPSSSNTDVDPALSSIGLSVSAASYFFTPLIFRAYKTRAFAKLLEAVDEFNYGD